jgi:hypothetical protein
VDQRQCFLVEFFFLGHRVTFRLVKSAPGAGAAPAPRRLLTFYIMDAALCRVGKATGTAMRKPASSRTFGIPTSFSAIVLLAA